MEEYFEDPSFIYYLIDNVERAMNNSQTDLDNFLDQIRKKTMRKYVKALKEDLKNEESVSLLKKLGTMFTMGDKSKDVKKRITLNPFLRVKEEEEENEDHDSKVSNGTVTLSQLKLAELPSGLKVPESKSN